MDLPTVLFWIIAVILVGSALLVVGLRNIVHSALALVVLLVLAAGGGAWQWRSASAAPPVQIMRVRVPQGAVAGAELVMLTATGYVMAAHKIELASKVIGRVAWVGVEMGDKIDKDQVLVRLEDDEYKARVAQQQGQLDNAKAMLAELEAGSRPQEIAAAQARLSQVGRVSAYARRAIRVAVEAATETDLELEIVYGVTGASWQPLYDLRLVESAVTLTYLLSSILAPFTHSVVARFGSKLLILRGIPG